MIRNFSDHAANERTFLAWVRTAIAIMAFGFLIEKFDIFLSAIASQLRSNSLTVHDQKFANGAGLAFILLGVVMIAIAGIRFFRITKELNRTETVTDSTSRSDLILASLLFLLGISLFLYLSRVAISLS